MARIIFDITNVLADFDRGMTEELHRLYPDIAIVPINEKKSAKFSDDYPESVLPLILKAYNRPGFYLSLPPIPGSIDAILELENRGAEIWLCGKPFEKFQGRIEQKYAWVDEHLGSRFVDRIILIDDKTLLRADILVDDKPEIYGREDPAWEHVLFSRPYNQQVTDRRRIDWNNWRTVLLAPR